MIEGRQHAIIPLRLMADEAHRELVMRHKVYPGRVKKGQMTELEAKVAIDTMRAIEKTLRMFAEHEPVMRSALEKAIEARKIADQDAAARLVMDELGAAPVGISFMEPGLEAGEQEGDPDLSAVEGPAP